MDDKRMELDNFELDGRNAPGRPGTRENARRVRRGSTAAAANRRQVRRRRTHAGALVDAGVEPRAANAGDEDRGAGVVESLELFLRRARLHSLLTAAEGAGRG